MSSFIEGEDRNQATLFPERLDDYVAEDNSVRVIDVFIDDLDISGLGFKAEPATTGRPGYHPKTMLKLYVYGYLNRVQSSRRLEVEAQRNVGLMWLTGRLAPDFKTIADFRKDNGEAIRLVCREFVMLCRKLNLLSEKLVAIDGSKFKAVNSRDRNFTRAKMKRRLRDVESAIDRYLARLDEADRSEPTPDDAKHHSIIPHEVTNVGSDRSQLSRMAKEAKAVLDVKRLDAVADRGYYNGNEIRACEQDGIGAYLPRPNTSPNKAKGQLDRSAFKYVAADDEYKWPAGERLIYRFTRTEANKEIRRYWTSACTNCAIKVQCTDGDYRRVSRWVHADVLERAQTRLDSQPELMQIRRSTVEHPFGTIKSWMGSTHFLMRTIPKVRTDMSLQVLAYNMKRAINLVGTRRIMETIAAYDRSSRKNTRQYRRLHRESRECRSKLQRHRRVLTQPRP